MSVVASITAWALGALLLNVWLVPKSRLRWQLRLLSLELGHWLGLLCAVLGAVSWKNGLFWLFAAGFAVPAFQALKIARRRKLPFSLFRLFWPFGLGSGVLIVRRPFWESEGMRLDVVIYRPAEAVAVEKRRCVLSFHSGGWDSGDAGEFRAANRAIVAECGVVLCSFGYRLAPAYAWPSQAEDVARAVAWVRANAAELGVDAEDLVLLGRSAGAQIVTACAFGRAELRVRGCIAVYGPPDMFFAREWSYPDDILKSLKLVRQYMAGEPEEVPENYLTASAARHISTKSPPTLLIHGASDCLVWVEHSRRMSRLMADTGRCSYLELPWGEHGCDFFQHSPGGQLARAEVVRFLATLA